MKPYRGIIISRGNEDIVAVAELLAARVRERLTYEGVPLPNDINLSKSYDFIMVGDMRVLRDVVERYRRVQVKPPLIIHVIYGSHERVITSYDDLTGVDISPIRQASLDTQDTTLQLDLFEKVLAVLDSSQV